MDAVIVKPKTGPALGDRVKIDVPLMLFPSARGSLGTVLGMEPESGVLLVRLDAPVRCSFSGASLQLLRLSPHVLTVPWMDWAGGPSPVPEHVKVRIFRRSGREDAGKAGDFVWEHRGWEWDVTRYRTDQ